MNNSENYQQLIQKNKGLKKDMTLMREKNLQLAKLLAKREAEIKEAHDFVHEKKTEWERTVHEKTLKRVALGEFPINFSASTLKLENSNE